MLSRLEKRIAIRNADLGLGAMAKLALFAIEELDGKGDGCWASIGRIAKVMNADRGTAKRAIARLAGGGFVRVDVGGGARSRAGGKPTNRTTIVMDRVIAACPDRGAAPRSDRGAETLSDTPQRGAETRSNGAQGAPDRGAAPHKGQGKDKEKDNQSKSAREATDPAPVFPVEQPTDEQNARLVSLVQQVEAAWPKLAKRRHGARDLQRLLSTRLHDLGLPDWDAPAVAALAYAASPLGRGRFSQQLGNWIRDEGWLEDPRSWEDDGEHEKRNGRRKSEAERLADLQRELAEADAADAEWLNRRTQEAT